MWWDWTQITLLDSVLFSILSLIILYFVGSGILKLVCFVMKTANPFSNSDFLQKSSFKILIGLCFALLLITFFSIFNLPFLISSLLVVALAVIGFIFKRPVLKLKTLPNMKSRYAILIAACVVLLVILFLSSNLIVGSYGSTNDDGADHTLLIRIIMNTPSELIARPVGTYDILMNYPTGSHVLCAFLATLLSVPIQKIVIMVSVILPCLIALSFYSAIKSLFKSRVLALIGLIIASFFSMGLSLGPLSWGGLPLLLSLFLSVSAIGLIWFLLEKKITYLNAGLVGLLFFVSSQVYPVALLMVFLWLLLFFCSKLSLKSQIKHGPKLSLSGFLSKRHIAVTVTFLLPLMFALPYFYSLFSYYSVGSPFANPSQATNLSVDVMKTRVNFDWLFDIPALSHFFASYGSLLYIAPFAIILLVILFIPQVSKRLVSFFPIREFRRGLFIVYFLVLLLMAYLTLSVNLPLNMLNAYLNPERVGGHVLVPAVILTASVIFCATHFGYLMLKRAFQKDKIYESIINRNRILACVLVILVLFSVSLAGVPIVREQQSIYVQTQKTLSVYETLNHDDLSLMSWIMQNIPSNAYILVSSGDSGQFAKAITQRQIVSVHSPIHNYSDLMALLTANASDVRAIPLIMQYNVSYVYIGSTPVSYAQQNPAYRHFNATQFLSARYFTVTKEVGNAWLFEYNNTVGLNVYNTEFKR